MTRPSYAEACATFRWEDTVDALGWRGAATVNLGHTLVDRDAASGRMALRWWGANGA